MGDAKTYRNGMRILFLSACFFLAAISFAQTKPRPAKNKRPERPPLEYFINQKAVSGVEFGAFLDQLKEVPGTWYCATTNRGGRTGYDALDTVGVIYRYRCTQMNDHTEFVIIDKKLEEMKFPK